MCDPVNILDGPIDRYNGILIDTEIANIVNNNFREQLESIFANFFFFQILIRMSVWRMCFCSSVMY